MWNGSCYAQKSVQDEIWVLGGVPDSALRTEMQEVHHYKKQRTLPYPSSSRSIPLLSKRSTIFQLTEDNSQSENMISSIRNVSRGVVRRGASLKQQCAMSTIVLPDLTFEYSHLEPVVRLILNFLPLNVMRNTTYIHSDDSASVDKSTSHFDASYSDIC